MLGLVSEEQTRLDELHRYDVLDSEREPAFDRLAEMGALACDAPVALITFVDETRQWSKAEHGARVGELARAVSLCAFAIRERALFVVEDAARDERFARNPLVSGAEALRFYAGAPLITPRGAALGTLCVLDRRPRRLGAQAERALVLLREQVMQLLESRRELVELRRSEGLRQEAVEALLATKTDLEKRIELRTREAEGARSRMAQILARVADGFVALDREWRYTYVNERAGQMLRRPPADLIGKHIWTIFPDGLGQPFQLAYEQAMRDQVPVTIVEHYAPWNRWFENRIYPGPEGISIFFTEITEHRRTQEELQATAHRLEEAQAVAHVGSWEWSVAGDRVVWSEEMFRIYGLTRDSFKGTYAGFLENVHPDDMEHTKQVIGDAYRQPKPFVYDHRIVRADGAVRMLHTRGDVITGDDGRPLRMIGSCWDITDRWLAATELEAVVEAVLESPHAMFTVDEGERPRVFNQRCLSLFDLPLDLLSRNTDAALAFNHIARRLSDGAAFLALVKRVQVERAASTMDRFVLAGLPVECRTTPYRIGGRIAGRVWTFLRD
jgi:PAS domain S-box-containing protein